ncbi:unnamed protein product [Phytophthora fragariaefolia]|uniref:Unnamed protein product n=1 Tax=Phytophthora fragariaefolia TaxID=1490495 RepID=A0A9W6XGL0_9STRA|nr:unnamed protein product [Phytophthora fragariaefolia]
MAGSRELPSLVYKGLRGLDPADVFLAEEGRSVGLASEHQDAFDTVKKNLASAPVLMLPDTSRPFHVVCDASEFASGCALMQFDAEGRERVVSYQSRQMKLAEKNYPVHEKELLAMRYALIKFRVYRLGEQTFAVYTDHASLRTAMKSPHLSQRMARWLSFFAEYDFVVHYKPGKNNILVDVLSRRPDYDPRCLTRHQDIPDDDDDEDCCATFVTLGINATVSSPVLPLRQQIVDAYEDDAFYAAIIRYLRNPTADTLAKLTRPTRDTITRYDLDGDRLAYAIDIFDPPHVVIPDDDDLRARLVHEYHDAPAGGHLEREKTFAARFRGFFWPRMYKWIRKWVRSCEICQRVKPAASKQAPIRPLPIATSAWRPVSMDCMFGFPRDAKGRTGVLVFVDRFSKMVHLAPVAAEVMADESAELFLDLVFRHHGLPESTGSVQPTDAPRRQSARSQAALEQTRYQRDGPPPLVDASGARRYVVECLVDHDTSAHRENPSRGNPNSVNTRSNRRQAPERYYRVRWLGHSPAEDTWESRSRLLEDVPDLVSDYEASLAVASASDCDCAATARAQDFANDCASGPARASHGDHPRGLLQLQDPCEPDHSARVTAAHLRSASRSSLDAPTRRASAADDLGTWRSLRPGTRSTDATCAVPSRTRLPEDPQ